MSALNPMQFAAYEPPPAQKDNTYPVWGEGWDTKIIHGRQPATHKAREAVIKSKVMKVIG